VLGRNRHILVGGALPLEVKVEVTLVRQDDLLCAHLIHEELAEVELARLIFEAFDLGLVSHH